MFHTNSSSSHADHFATSYHSFSVFFISRKKDVNAMSKKRKYYESYLQFGFISIVSNDIEKPQCVLCMNVLSAESMKPSKLKRHLETSHPDYKDKNLGYFERKATGFKRARLDSSGVFRQEHRAAVEASFIVSLRIAKAKKPHTIAEDLILPCAKDINRLLIGPDAEKKLNQLSLSDNTVQRRISMMADNIKDQVISKVRTAGLFALQLDESTDVSSCAQLLVYARYLQSNTFKDEFLCCLELSSRTRGEDVFEAVDDFFKVNCLQWSELCGSCTDGAPAMLGHHSGFQARVRAVAPKCSFVHCMIHRGALASRTLLPELHAVLKNVIKLVNYIKSSALNTRLFRKLCGNMDADHQNLLFHTEVRWLCRGNVVKRVFDLRTELIELFTQQSRPEFVQLLQENVISIAYLVDIFGKLNELNLSLQGKNKTIIDFVDTLSAFVSKLRFWNGKMALSKTSMFPVMNELLEDNDELKLDENIRMQISENLKSLSENFAKYFPGISSKDLAFVRNPFLVPDTDIINMFNDIDELQEQFIELQKDSTALDIFTEKSLSSFWSEMLAMYPQVAKAALVHLMPFPSTYLCETGFSTLLNIKSKCRSRLVVEPDLRCSLSETSPRIDKLVSNMQHHPSH